MNPMTKQCKRCGVDFTGPAWHIKRRAYCGSVCYHADRERLVVGEKFGYWTILALMGDKKLCQCVCGNQKSLKTQAIKSGKSKSCGCKTRELIGIGGTTHGGTKTSAYHRWDAMLQRCNNPNNNHFRNYGGRGIAVCERWHDFVNFVEDMGQPPPNTSIERIDNSKGYFKENCAWVDRKTQQRNRRACRYIEHNGRKQCVTAWCEELSINVATFYYRVKNGKTEHQALGLV